MLFHKQVLFACVCVHVPVCLRFLNQSWVSRLLLGHSLFLPRWCLSQPLFFFVGVFFSSSISPAVFISSVSLATCVAFPPLVLSSFFLRPSLSLSAFSFLLLANSVVFYLSLRKYFVISLLVTFICSISPEREPQFLSEFVEFKAGCVAP